MEKSSYTSPFFGIVAYYQYEHKNIAENQKLSSIATAFREL